MLLAYEMIEGSSIDGLDPDGWTDELVRGIWAQVVILRRERIAHRDLRRANVFVDPDGTPWIIDFGFSELAATDRMLDQDAAQLLAATTIAVGPDRAVAAAVAVLGPEPVGRALAYLQLPAFAGATRTALRKQKDLLPALRTAVMDATGVSAIEYEPVNRVTPRTALMLVCSLVAIYVLIPQFADVTGMFRQLEDANWGLVLVVVLFSFLTYCGGSISLLAACPVPIRPADAIEVGLAGSFMNRITPAGIGGIGLNIRFMQKAGADTTEAASRWGVNALAGGIAHVTYATLFLLWARQDNAFDFQLPEMPIIVGIAVVCVLAGVVFLLPYGRHKLLGPVRRVAAHAWEGVRSVAREPRAAGRDVPGRIIRNVGLSVRALRRGTGVRRDNVPRRGRRGVPRRFRDRPSRADTGRARRGRGRAHRGPHRRGARQGDRRPRRASLPLRDVLAPHPPGMVELPFTHEAPRDLRSVVSRGRV